jgi:hypothetical protein
VDGGEKNPAYSLADMVRWLRETVPCPPVSPNIFERPYSGPLRCNSSGFTEGVSTVFCNVSRDDGMVLPRSHFNLHTRGRVWLIVWCAGSEEEGSKEEESRREEVSM